MDDKSTRDAPDIISIRSGCPSTEEYPKQSYVYQSTSQSSPEPVDPEVACGRFQNVPGGRISIWSVTWVGERSTNLSKKPSTNQFGVAIYNPEI
jgi:hypothetical protein